MKKITTALMCLTVMFLITSCQKENEQKLDINMPNVLSIEIDQTAKLDVTVTSNNIEQNVSLLWHSSNPDIAIVDEQGSITALKEGSSVITVSVSGNDCSADCNVNVVNKTDDCVAFEDNLFYFAMLDFDTNNDGKIQKSEAEAVKEINVIGREIKSLKGIECFTNLEKLYCYQNSLTELNVSQNKALKSLICNSNFITSLDVSALEKLEELNCYGNRLTAIDVSHNPELVFFKCGMNNGGMTDDYGIREVDVTKNPKLEVLDVYYLHISKLDVTKNPKLKKLDMGYCCHTMWSLATPIEEIDLSNNPDLEDLNCVSSNVPGFGLNSLDVSHNPKLKYLTTYGNPKIKELDLTNCPSLERLNSCHNDLSKLDVTKCPLLTDISCEYNSITELDLRGNLELKYLNCANNKIEELDFSNTKLAYLLAQNNKITQINFGDKTFDTQWPNGSGGTRPYLYMKLNDNLLQELDISKQTYLAWLEVNDNLLTKLDIRNCVNIGGLLCRNNRLVELHTEGCDLWQLDYTGNPGLN